MSEPTPFSPSERLHTIQFAVPRDLIELALDGIGYEDSEPLGDSYAELAARIHPHDAQEMRAKVDQHLRNETPF